MTTPHPDPDKWWRHRRAHSYISIVWVIVQTIMWTWVAISHPSALLILGGVIGWSYAIPIVVISWYFGNTLAELIIGKKTPW